MIKLLLLATVLVPCPDDAAKLCVATPMFMPDIAVNDPLPEPDPCMTEDTCNAFGRGYCGSWGFEWEYNEQVDIQENTVRTECNITCRRTLGTATIGCVEVNPPGDAKPNDPTEPDCPNITNPLCPDGPT